MPTTESRPIYDRHRTIGLRVRCDAKLTHWKPRFEQPYAGDGHYDPEMDFALPPFHRRYRRVGRTDEFRCDVCGETWTNMMQATLYDAYPNPTVEMFVQESSPFMKRRAR